MPQRPTVEVDGGEIRRERLRNGMEMADLAEAAGITANYLSRIETGTRRRLRPSKYAALCAHLDAPHDRFLARNEDNPQRTT
jgi:transcriptional regulator with XRE-family HTH domain